MKIHAGTSGFSYKEWVGSFYPDKTAPGDMLAFYATQLPAVEINNTFYRMPRQAVLSAWRDSVPSNFRFAIKTSRRITHSKKLADADDELSYLLGNLEVLGESLGALLFQLPPFLRKDAALLERFAAALPGSLPAAFEFRHGSWFDDEIAAILGRHNYPWVVSETDGSELPARLATADWGYLRLRRADYTDAELVAWRERIAQQEWKHVYAFFKHEDDAGGPALAQRFLAAGNAA